jgi:hypothetical protein
MHAKPGSIATRCPTDRSVTLGPIREIMPADSWPNTGGLVAGFEAQTCASEPQIPVEITSMRTSSSLRDGTSRCWTDNLDGAAQKTERFLAVDGSVADIEPILRDEKSKWRGGGVGRT